MITLIYRIIVGLVLALVVVNLFEKERIRDQANAALILLPLILRILMIK